LPANSLTPSAFVQRCREIATASGLQIQVLEKKELMKLGAGGLLGVSAGSSEPPYLVKLTYAPKKASKRKIALVGKGITFDTGGLCIKPYPGIEQMKCDMGGAAAVLGAMQAIAELKPAHEIRGYLAICENMISGSAMRPSDVITAMNGKTIEVINTDAEGRLVLSDALVLAEREGAQEIVDIATLTGAIRIALGNEAAGLFSNSDAFAATVEKAAAAAGERFWRMPIIDSYKAGLKSDVADFANSGERPGGAIRAAVFLKEFINKARWAHLDIASTSFSNTDWGPYGKGGTGFGVSTLVHLIT
jgi:leucyl aminopeptidase